MTPPQLRLAVQSRVIVDNDWSGDPDGLVALAHHLLSPTNRVVAVTSSMINPVFGQPEGAVAGAALARELVDLVALPEPPPVHAGSNGPFGDSASVAADAIVAEALRDDELPLLLVCGGPLTNVAQALQQAPEIASRLTLVWIGGALDPAADEYNRDTDPVAAEYVFGTPGLAIWQFPLETYRSCAYSVAELEADLGAAAGSGSGCGPGSPSCRCPTSSSSEGSGRWATARRCWSPPWPTSPAPTARPRTGASTPPSTSGCCSPTCWPGCACTSVAVDGRSGQDAGMPLFTGVGVALVTLFRPDGALDAPATADLAAQLAGLGVRCILAAGTTGRPPRSPRRSATS